ncbi:hypothetical protein [Pseudoalteromonas byunsanensis]|uniref:Uncharacterized protein n=1 Tax=Pseudoalteromonas byunsanensis TaxID=327939 RepID=A0A1S1MY12_9GAMM|nr:hypothetical protein [Pseudoalteromonas byunsanensis]OHU93800.1 hypothetical protein BIW53_16225 [Pseudoalteromonas byunsanensis]
MNSQEIGKSLASKAPWALLLNIALFALLGVIDGAPLLANLLFALLFGAISTALLLLYWHEKGGSFFIFALLMPLLLIILSELNNFIALAWVINGYFFGFAIALIIYRLAFLKDTVVN